MDATEFEAEFEAPMKHFGAVLTATPINSNSTTVTIMMIYAMKYRPIGYIIGVTIAKGHMKHIVGYGKAVMDQQLHTGATICHEFVAGRQ